MLALHPSHEHLTKLIVSLPTFSGRAHLPTHALYYYARRQAKQALDKAQFGGGWGWGLLKIKGFVLMYIVPPLGPSYKGESAKAYGLKVRCLYEEHVGEHIVNLGNILGTH